MDYFLDIAVLSYNRTVELERTLHSLLGIDELDVRVCVYEDCSPSQLNIGSICARYSKDLLIDLEYSPSPVNLGYDANLMRAVSTDSRYVLLLSDDDYIQADMVVDFVRCLRKFLPDVVITPFIKNGALYRPGMHNTGNYSIDVLYDSILFSGLAFKTSVVSLSDDEASFLASSIYTQVYLVGKHWSRNCLYFDRPMIVAGEDGENYFGKSEVTVEMSNLRDRTVLISNLYYQVHLQRVAFYLLQKNYSALVNSFVQNYSKRLVSHFVRVKLSSSFTTYFRSAYELKHIAIKYNYVYLIFIVAVGFVPKSILRRIYDYMICKFRISGG